MPAEAALVIPASMLLAAPAVLLHLTRLAAFRVPRGLPVQEVRGYREAMQAAAVEAAQADTMALTASVPLRTQEVRAAAAAPAVAAVRADREDSKAADHLLW